MWVHPISRTEPRATETLVDVLRFLQRHPLFSLLRLLPPAIADREAGTVVLSRSQLLLRRQFNDGYRFARAALRCLNDRLAVSAFGIYHHCDSLVIQLEDRWGDTDAHPFSGALVALYRNA
jgi:hypothetical protein